MKLVEIFFFFGGGVATNERLFLQVTKLRPKNVTLCDFPLYLSHRTRSAARRCGQFAQLSIWPLVAWTAKSFIKQTWQSEVMRLAQGKSVTGIKPATFGSQIRHLIQDYATPQSLLLVELKFHISVNILYLETNTTTIYCVNQFVFLFVYFIVYTLYKQLTVDHTLMRIHVGSVDRSCRP
jgi:hypothetical protein